MDIMSLLRQAQEMKKNMEQAQADLEQLTVSGSAGGGMVSAEVNGHGQIRGVKIDRSVVNPDDVEMLEDLVTVAIADAQKKAASELQVRMPKLPEGMNIPGLKLPF
jgi:DNA-binding YbaB/EbfC family protein